MTITIEPPLDLEQEIAHAAAQQNMTVEQYTLYVLRATLPSRTQPERKVVSRGKYAHFGPSSDDFMARKADEKALEERH